MLRAILILMFFATAASAGPWPREEGKGFLSISADLDAEDGKDNFLSFYLEYGLSRDRTFGIDRRESGDEIAKTIAFLRYPVGATDRRLKLAYEIGLGILDNDAALRPGVSVGRGFEMAQRSGWWTWDTRALLVEDTNMTLAESDITFGLQTNASSKLILQVQTGVPRKSDAYVKLAPSLAIQSSEGRHYTIGVTAGVVENNEVKVNFGLWQEF